MTVHVRQSALILAHGRKPLVLCWRRREQNQRAEWEPNAGRPRVDPQPAYVRECPPALGSALSAFDRLAHLEHAESLSESSYAAAQVCDRPVSSPEHAA